MFDILGAGGASALMTAVASTVGAAGSPIPLPVMPAITQAVAFNPLEQLVEANRSGLELDAEGQCLATAIYFESRGEPLQGQLAVADVVMNRAQSGQYPTSLCGVVKQKAQFSFVRGGGRFPAIDAGCEAWARAQAIARIALQQKAVALPSDVLWYHADYVAPSWGGRLTRVDKIGAHIFYRA